MVGVLAAVGCHADHRVDKAGVVLDQPFGVHGPHLVHGAALAGEPALGGQPLGQRAGHRVQDRGCPGRGHALSPCWVIWNQ